MKLIFCFINLISLVLSDPNKILPCFAPYNIGTAQPLVAIYYTTLYDCLMSCLTGSEQCLSVVWDDRQHNCYLYGVTGTGNPAILLNRYGTTYYERISNPNVPTCGNVPGGTGPVVSPVAPVAPTNGTGLSCPQRSSTAYFVTPGAQLTTTSNAPNSSVIPNVGDENVCISACTDQQNSATGGAVGCSSFTSLRSGNSVTCTLSSTVASPDGPGVPVPNPQAFLFQKFCLPAGAPPTCFEQFFFLLPATNLPEHTIATGKAVSVADCAGQCVANGKCRAAVYDAGTQVCVLKDATTTAPGQTSSNPNQYYVENGCLLGQRGGGPGAGTPGGRALLTRFFQRVRLAKSRVKTITDEPTTESQILDQFLVTDNLFPEGATTKLIPVDDDDDKTGEPLPTELSVWTHWSVCKFNVGGRRARVRTRNCFNFSKCPDKDIEFEICSNSEIFS